MTIKVNEIFGPTVQGEGAAAGRHCLFVRVANCNLRCGWCDTSYTWAFNPQLAGKLELPIEPADTVVEADGVRYYDKTQNLREMHHYEILDELRKLWDVDRKPTMIVISGGEPMMQTKQLEPLVRELFDRGNMVHVETAGTLMPSPAFDNCVAQYNVSPKLEHSGNRFEMRFKPEVLRFFANSPKAWFKYVLRTPEDLNEVDWQVETIGINPHQVMVMPEGVTAEKNMEIAKKLVDPAVARGYGISYRTHILLWKDVRGK